MKQEKRNESKAESQNQFSIQDALTGQIQTSMQVQSQIEIPQSPLPLVVTELVEVRGRGEASFPISPPSEGQGGGFRGLRVGYGREGPPGRARSPGTGISPFRDHPPDGKKGNQLSMFIIELSMWKDEYFMYKEEDQYFNKKQKTNFFNHLIFNIMKKQILILVLFVMATFASTSVFGQALHFTSPQALSCENDPLHPIAGKKYTYGVNIDAASTGGNYTWWATKETDFMSSTGTAPTQTTTTNVAGRLTVDAAQNELLYTNTDYGTTVASPVTTVIAWSSALLNGTSYLGADAAKSPTFVVVHYEATGTVCADNIKVYEINPINGFTVDIKNIDRAKISAAGVLAVADTLTFGDAATQCVDIVRGATYNATDHGIDYDYGTNYLYYEVVAANFSKSYTPSFKIDGLLGTQEADIEWSYDLTFGTTVVVTTGALIGDNGTGATGTAFVSPDPVETTETNTSNGVSMYVRVTVRNKTFETTAIDNITVSVDGQSAVGDYDVVNGTGSDDCTTTALADWLDTSIQTVDPRPTVTTNTTILVPATVMPQDLILGN